MAAVIQGRALACQIAVPKSWQAASETAEKRAVIWSGAQLEQLTDEWRDAA